MALRTPIAEAMAHLRFNSILRDANTMAPGRQDGIIKHTLQTLMQMAVDEEGPNDWIARTLHAGDMPPTATTARNWLETTGTTSETFVDAAIGNGTQIADQTFIGIYGFQFLSSERRLLGIGDRVPYLPPVTAIRFVVGGTRVAEWDLYNIWRTGLGKGAGCSVGGSGNVGTLAEFPLGIGESPIFIAQNKTLLVQYYEQVPTTGVDFMPHIKGIVVEKRGAGDGLNP